MSGFSELANGIVLTVDNKEWEWDFADQSSVTVTDKRGYKIYYHLYEGIHYSPMFTVAKIKQVRGFKMRPDDIYFTSYPRTGAHWTYERICMLINGKADTIPHFKKHIEVLPESHFESLPSPRVIHAHMHMSKSPEKLLTKKCKVVYTMRDPKDVIVSLYLLHYESGKDEDQYLGTFGDFLLLFLSGRVENNGLFEHCRDAEKYFEDHPEVPVHISIYEDSHKDPVKAVQELSDFLGLPRNDALCNAIAAKCEFSKLKTDKGDYSVKVDGESILFRQGTTGDWKSWFTEEMLDEYYKVYEEKMAGSRFYHRYSRNATSS